jgi:GNAT superfamily N-acetyltransferase
MRILKGYMSGAIGRVTELHGLYYHEHWGFDHVFEAKIATGLSSFFGRYDERKDGFWSVVSKDRIEGSIAIDGTLVKKKGAHLRWYIVSDEIRGKGMGSQLLERALAFCQKRNYKQVYLWTFAGLEAARHLYEKAGFELVEEKSGARWGTTVKEQRFELQIP